MTRIDPQARRQALKEGQAVGHARFGNSVVRRGPSPDREAVPPPVKAERPARQRLARVPFALAVVDKGALAEPAAQAVQQLPGDQGFCRARGVGGPFRRFEVVD